jgi:spermidine/putrescine transport system permease protein
MSQTSALSRFWRWIREHAVLVVGLLVIAYMLVPIAVIFVFSFNNPAGRYNFTWSTGRTSSASRN